MDTLVGEGDCRRRSLDKGGSLRIGEDLEGKQFSRMRENHERLSNDNVRLGH